MLFSSLIFLHPAWYLNRSFCFAENVEKSLVYSSDEVLKLLLSHEPKEVDLQKFLQSLQLDQASLEQAEAKTKTLVRYVATKAKQLNRLDVVKHLREITPAGMTGECVHRKCYTLYMNL